MSDLHFRNLEQMFAAASINQELITWAKLEVSSEQAVLVLKMRDEYYHAAMSLHGAIYFKLLDDSAYFAAASAEPTYFLYTKSYQINFRRPVTGGVLTATGRLLKKADKEWIATSEIRNEQNQLVAAGEGIFVKSKLLLTDLVGYSGS